MTKAGLLKLMEGLADDAAVFVMPVPHDPAARALMLDDQLGTAYEAEAEAVFFSVGDYALVIRPKVE